MAGLATKAMAAAWPHVEVHIPDVVVDVVARPDEQRAAPVEDLSKLLVEAQASGLGVIHVR